MKKNRLALSLRVERGLVLEKRVRGSAGLKREVTSGHGRGKIERPKRHTMKHLVYRDALSDILPFLLRMGDVSRKLE